MSDDPVRYRVFNNRNQPVELYFGLKVVVVPPRGFVELEEIDLAAAQLRRLLDQGAFSVQKVAQPPPGPKEPEKKPKGQPAP